MMSAEFFHAAGRQGLGSALQHFYTVAGHLGLRLSWQKTKVQNLGAGYDVGDVTICGQTVEGVSKFVYLGSQLSSMGTCTEEVLRRIGIASSAMNSMQTALHLASEQNGTGLPIVVTGSRRDGPLLST